MITKDIVVADSNGTNVLMIPKLPEGGELKEIVIPGDHKNLGYIQNMIASVSTVVIGGVLSMLTASPFFMLLPFASFGIFQFIIMKAYKKSDFDDGLNDFGLFIDDGTREALRKSVSYSKYTTLKVVTHDLAGNEVTLYVSGKKLYNYRPMEMQSKAINALDNWQSTMKACVTSYDLENLRTVGKEDEKLKKNELRDSNVVEYTELRNLFNDNKEKIPKDLKQKIHDAINFVGNSKLKVSRLMAVLEPHLYDASYEVYGVDGSKTISTYQDVKNSEIDNAQDMYYVAVEQAIAILKEGQAYWQ